MLDFSLQGLSDSLSNMVGDVDYTYEPTKALTSLFDHAHLAVGDHNSYSYSYYSYYGSYSYYSYPSYNPSYGSYSYSYYYGYATSYWSSYGYYYDNSYSSSYMSEYYGISYSYDTAYDETMSYRYYYDPDTNYYYDQKTEEEVWLIILYVFLGILGFFLILFLGGLLLGLLAMIWSGTSFVGLLLFPPMAVCLITTGGRLSECTLGYIETDGTSWPYDFIVKPLSQFIES